MRSIHLHLSVQPVVEDEVVGHSYSVRLHRVTLPVVVVADVAVVVVTHFSPKGMSGHFGNLDCNSLLNLKS